MELDGQSLKFVVGQNLGVSSPLRTDFHSKHYPKQACLFIHFSKKSLNVQ